MRIARIALFTGLLTICAYISLPLGDIRFSLQLLAIWLACGMLPFWDAAACVVLYIFLGAIGLPVFTGFQGGAGSLLGPTGGFIIGFIFSALFAGFFLKGRKRSAWRLAGVFAVATLICYLFGSIWFAIYMPEKGILYAATVCVLPYILPDAAKIFAATVLLRRLEKVRLHLDAEIATKEISVGTGDKKTSRKD